MATVVVATLVLLEGGVRTMLEARARMRRDLPYHLGAALVVAAFVVVSAVVPPWGPIHDHGSFVARSDAAWAHLPGPHNAWAQPAFDVWGAILHAMPMPYGTRAVAAASLVLAALSLVLLYAFVLAFGAQFHLFARPHRVALWATGLLAANPIFVRVSVGGTMYPYVVVTLLASGVAAMLALRLHRLRYALGSAAFLSLATWSNWGVLPWIGLAAVAPLAWLPAGLPTRRVVGALVCSGATLGLLAIPNLPGVLALLGTGPSALHAWGGITSQFPFRPAEFPVVVSVLWAVGLCTVVAGAGRPYVPVLYAYGVVAATLSGMVTRLDSGYPTRFIHGYVSLVFVAFFAAVGIDAVLRLRPLDRAKPLAVVALVALVAGSTLQARDACTFFSESLVLNREYAAIAEQLPGLPEHDVLVIPDRIQTGSSPPSGADPVEVVFPLSEYLESYTAVHDTVPTVVRLDDYLRVRSSPRERVLVYVGSGLRSWLRSEIRDGQVPDGSPDRPSLTRLREVADLVPVGVFELEAAQNPHAEQRLGADRTPTVELGFYQVQVRPEFAAGEDQFADLHRSLGEHALPDGPGARPYDAIAPWGAIGPGREAEVLGLFGGHALPAGWQLTEIAVDGGAIRASIAGPGGDGGQLLLTRPTAAGLAKPSTRSFSVALVADTVDAREALAALAATVARNDDGSFWRNGGL